MPSERNSVTVLPWIVVVVMLLVISVFGFVYRGTSVALMDHSTKLKAINSIRIHLLKAIEAEKSAVLSTTDDDSKRFADEAQSAVGDVEADRQLLMSLIEQTGAAAEKNLLEEFNTSWSEFRKLDEQVLQLATQNSNLKAKALSSTQFAREVAVLQENLKILIRDDTKDDQPSLVSVHCYKAINAVLQVFAQHQAHIEEANDAAMDRMEFQMREELLEAGKSFSALKDVPELRSSQPLKDAEKALEEIRELNAEILKLSRLNTNIKSLELSLGRKRLVSAKCQEVLTSLQAQVDSHQVRATK